MSLGRDQAAMKAIELREFGPAENYRVVEVPIPEPAAGEVLIKVEAAGIIFTDTQMRRGLWHQLHDQRLRGRSPEAHRREGGRCISQQRWWANLEDGPAGH